MDFVLLGLLKLVGIIVLGGWLLYHVIAISLIWYDILVLGDGDAAALDPHWDKIWWHTKGVIAWVVVSATYALFMSYVLTYNSVRLSIKSDIPQQTVDKDAKVINNAPVRQTDKERLGFTRKEFRGNEKLVP